MKYDIEGEGYGTLFKPYQIETIKYLYEVGEAGSGKVHAHLQANPDEDIRKSRASAIFFLNDMVEEGILTYYEEPGKGGYHRVYSPAMKDEAKLKEYLVRKVVRSLSKSFPEAYAEIFS